MPVSGNGHVHASAAMLGGIPDAQIDPGPFWNAMLRFDRDGDGKIARGEMTEHFTFPLRPELLPEQPGFGIPLPDDEAGRKERQAGIFGWVDSDRDGFWTREELAAGLSTRPGKPMLLAIRPGGKGEVMGTHVTWQLNRSIPEIPSPLFHEDRLYLVRDGGFLTVVDASGGSVVYTKRLGGSGQYSASPVLANEHLYTISNRGLVSVVKAGDSFQLVHEQDLGETAVVTPAFDASTIYIRTETSLRAFRERD